MFRFLPAAVLLLTACNGASAVSDTATHAQGESAPAPGVDATTLRSGLDHPWSLAFLPNGSMLVTERSGQLRLLADDGSDIARVEGLPEVYVENQSGLLEVTLHPDFAANDELYLSYGRRCEEGGATTAVSRARLQRDGDSARLVDREEILVADACHPGGRHMAGRMVFDDDGHLFVAIGDRGIGEEEDNAAVQDPHNHVATVLRLNDDGSAAAGNPFSDGASGDPKVYSMGLRNIQGMAVHPDSAEVWIHKHGPRGGDEVAILRAGANFGWPERTHGTHYDGRPIGPDVLEGFDQPLLHWTPSIAPSGMAFVTQDSNLPDWRGDIIVGALRAQLLSRLRWDAESGRLEEGARHFVNELGRIRDVRSGPDGALYLLTDSADGKLLRLSNHPG